MCGDDQAAKDLVAGLIEDMGYVPVDPRRRRHLRGDGGAAAPCRGLRRGISGRGCPSGRRRRSRPGRDPSHAQLRLSGAAATPSKTTLGERSCPSVPKLVHTPNNAPLDRGSWPSGEFLGVRGEAGAGRVGLRRATSLTPTPPSARRRDEHPRHRCRRRYRCRPRRCEPPRGRHPRDLTRPSTRADLTRHHTRAELTRPPTSTYRG
jgi:hypothetical protein